MRVLFVIAATILAVYLGFLACALGTGWVLHWLLPSLEFGTAAVVASVANLAILLGLLRLVTILPMLPSTGIRGGSMDDDENEEDEEDDFGDDEEPSARGLPPLGRRQKPKRRTRYRRRT